MTTVVGDLVNALHSATSQDPIQVKHAEQWLKQQEITDNFYVKLSEICRMQEIEWPARWMAAIYLKNGIERCWRPCTSYSIEPQGKDKIKNNMLECLEEPVNQIAMQLYVGIAKIARMDYPDQWESLLPSLFSGLSSPRNSLHQTRCLSALTHVIKTLSLKKLPYAKEVYANFCNNTYKDMFVYWAASVDAVTSTMKSESMVSSVSDMILENCIATTKIAYYMIKKYDAEVLTKIYETTYKHLFEMKKISQQLQNKQQEYCKKICIVCIKILDSLLSVGSKSYVIGAQKTMSLFCDYIYGLVGQDNDEHDEKFIVKCVNSCKAILENSNFEEVFLDGGKDISKIGPSIETLFQCLVCHYLPLKEEGLVSWEEDAEEFCCEEFGESWKFRLRPSVEVLSLTLLKKFQGLLVPTLLKMLDVVQDLNARSINDTLSGANPVLQVILKGCTTMLECMVRKEAVYYMVGLAIHDVADCLDIQQWFMNKLLPEVKSVQEEGHGKLIHRRVLWLISQWCELPPPLHVRRTLYMFVVVSMQKNFDSAVRLTASSALRDLLDDFEFDIAQFQEYQDASFKGLYELLLDLKNCDTKMRVLHVITFLIERLGRAIEPYSQTISNIVPQLWENAINKNHDMLKCAIMNMVIQFIYGLGEKSDSIMGLTVPLVQASIDLTNPSHVYLLEDGLELWLTAVQNCTDPNQVLFELFDSILPVLEYGSETLKTCFSIIESYVFLYGESLLEKYGTKLDESFVSLSTDVRNECLVLISGLVSIFTEIPQNSHIFCVMYCQKAIEVSLSEKDTVLLSMNFTLAANVIMKSIVTFLGIIKQISQVRTQDFGAILQTFIKTWCNSIDSIVEVDKKKLSGLALLTLCANIKEIPHLSAVFANAICAVVQILYDVCDEGGRDNLVHVEDGLYKDDCNNHETQHDRRRSLFRKHRHVAVISLPSFAALRIKTVQDTLSPEHFAQLMGTIDTESATELQNFDHRNESALRQPILRYRKQTGFSHTLDDSEKRIYVIAMVGVK